MIYQKMDTQILANLNIYGNNMHLSELTISDCEIIRHWRNADISHLRTPFFLTQEMQQEFYHTVICDRKSNCRFWSVRDGSDFIGMVGLVNISIENRSAEISIIINPKKHRNGYGKKSINMLLEKGFYELNLENIYGECYENSAHIGFWENYCELKQVEVYPLPNRKFYNGKYYDSIYFNFMRDCV